MSEVQNSYSELYASDYGSSENSNIFIIMVKPDGCCMITYATNNKRKCYTWRGDIRLNDGFCVEERPLKFRKWFNSISTSKDFDFPIEAVKNEVAESYIHVLVTVNKYRCPH